MMTHTVTRAATQAAEPRSVRLSDGRFAVMRAAGPDDAADLLVIQRQIVEEDISNVGCRLDTLDERCAKLTRMDPRTLWVVAETSGQVVGSVELAAAGPDYLDHLRNLHIDLHRDWRAVGLGTALLHYAFDLARAQGVELIALSVLDTNPRAKTLYERLGFRVTGHVPRLVKRRDGTYTGDTQMLLVL